MALVRSQAVDKISTVVVHRNAVLTKMSILSIIDLMRTVSATDAKQRMAALLDAAQREPVLIRRQTAMLPSSCLPRNMSGCATSLPPISNVSAIESAAHRPRLAA